MAASGEPVFGVRRPGARYVRRLCAFGIAADGQGRVACVEIARNGQTHWDLPGGKRDRGESETRALVREYAEETGLAVEPGALVARTRQYLVNASAEHRLNVSAYYAVRIIGPAPGGKVEDDHRLVWLDPLEALERLRDDAAAWAIAAWLRTGGVPA